MSEPEVEPRCPIIPATMSGNIYNKDVNLKCRASPAVPEQELVGTSLVKPVGQ